MFETGLAYQNDGVLNLIFYGVTEVVAMSKYHYLLKHVVFNFLLFRCYSVVNEWYASIALYFKLPTLHFFSILKQ